MCTSVPAMIHAIDILYDLGPQRFIKSLRSPKSDIKGQWRNLGQALVHSYTSLKLCFYPKQDQPAAANRTAIDDDVAACTWFLLISPSLQRHESGRHRKRYSGATAPTEHSAGSASPGDEKAPARDK